MKREYMYVPFTTPIRTSRDRFGGVYSIAVDYVDGRYNDRKEKPRRTGREELIGEDRFGRRPERYNRFENHSYRPSSHRSNRHCVTQIPRHNAYVLEEEEFFDG